VFCHKIISPRLHSCAIAIYGHDLSFFEIGIISEAWPPPVDLLIVSAKYGLLTPLAPIPFYDQQLTLETVPTIERAIREQLKSLELNKYVECFFNLLSLYLKAITGIELALQDAECQLIRGQGTQAKRNSEMLQWLSSYQ
jgi:hypothetical protein